MTEEQRYAKVPDGMEIKKPDPEQNPQPKPLKVKDFTLDPGLPIIQYPHYVNNAKTELSCLLVRPDGMATQEQKIPKDENHPLYRDIRNQFTEEEILTNTAREVQIQTSRNKAMEEAMELRAKPRQSNTTTTPDVQRVLSQDHKQKQKRIWSKVR